VLTIEIVHARDPQASRAALLAAIEAATQTPQGRARLALIAALSTVTGWYNPHAPRPADRDSWILGQAAWLHDAYTLSLGPTGRVDLEAKVGGNPSTTVGVDYVDHWRRISETRRRLAVVVLGRTRHRLLMRAPDFRRRGRAATHHRTP
jgi:hypothetical protein